MAGDLCIYDIHMCMTCQHLYQREKSKLAKCFKIYKVLYKYVHYC